MLTRRRLLTATALSTAAILTRPIRAVMAEETKVALPIPSLIDLQGERNAATLRIAEGSHAYRAGQNVKSFGYSSPVLGPTLRIGRGATASLTIENRLARPTTVHWHGLIVPGDVDGGPHSAIAPGAKWTASLPIDQPESTAWYHPHPHAETAAQVYSGLAGLLLVHDGSGERLGLPVGYGIDDLPLVLQDRFIDRSGAPVYRPGPMDIIAGYRGDTPIANGVVDPVATVPPGLVRLRFLNGANARIFDLRFSDSRPMHVIASDGGYLPAPVSLQRLLVAPGERFEVLVDFSDRAEVTLRTGYDQNASMMGMMRGDPLAQATILSFRIDPQLQARVTALPQKLVDIPLLDRSKAVTRRTFQLNDMMMGGMMGRGMMGGMGRGGGLGPAMAINGRSFEMHRIDFGAKRGTLEVWDIRSQSMMHPFHIHGTQFQILSLDGERPPRQQQGWKDTVLVAEQAEILVPISQAAGRDHPFMYHCHILEHEDAGMMGQFVCT